MSNAKLVQRKCPQCGAPLSVGVSASSVTCTYCGAVHTVSQAKPPPVQKFGGGGAPVAAPNVVYVGQPSAAAGVWVLFAIAFVVLSSIGGIIGKTTHIFVSLPLTCHTNESISIKGKHYNGPGPAIEVGTNCKITIENSTLTSADEVISGGAAYNVELRIVNSTITSSKGHAIDLGTNAKVFMRDKSKVVGAEAGLHSTGNLELDVKDSAIEGATAGVSAESNEKISLTNAQITGKDHALLLGSNAKLTAKSSTLKSDDIGIETKSSASFDLQDTTITSGDDGIRLSSSSADIKLSKKTAIVAKKGAGIHAMSSSNKFSLDDARVECDGTGIDTNSSSEVRLRGGAYVRGGNVGIDSTSSLKLTLDSGKIESQRVAVRGGSGGEIRVSEGTTIKAPKPFEFSYKPSRFDVPASVVPLELQDTSTGGSGSGGGSPSSSSQEIARAFAQANPGIKTCAVGQKGVLRLRVTIAPNGAVTSVEAVTSTVPASVSNCMMQKVRAVKFPAQGSTSVVTQTYVFN